LAANPLFLEFAFESCARPIDIGEGADVRQLAVGFKRIVLRDAAGLEVGRVDFTAPDPAGAELVCGIDRGESWGGAWSDGATACLLLSTQAPQPICTLEVEHVIYPRAGSRIPTRVRCNGLEIGRVHFEGGRATIEIPSLDGLAHARRNLSLVADIAPDVSVLILNFNRPDLTRKAVLSLLAGMQRCSVEIIVVDNGSSEERFAELAAMQLPVRLIRFDQGCGFAEGNHHAAELARGRHLLLMNNDVFITHGVVDRLHDVLEQHPQIGATGPVFRFPDGKLQEAGGVVTPAGDAFQRGAGDPAFALEPLPLLDEVGYISAACLMVRARDFIELGGFDPAFEPAYYEDTDFCQRLRATGKTTVLARKALVFHVMNATTRDPQAGIAINDVGWCNRLRFASRWGDRQAERNPATRPPVAPPEARAATNATMRFCMRLHKPLRGEADEYSALALAEALAQFGSSQLVTEPATSALRLRFAAARLGLPATSVAMAKNGCADGAISVSRGDAGSLEIAGRVIVDSACARRTLLGQWQSLGVTPQPIEVLYPPVDRSAFEPAATKENLIVCRGAFSSLHIAHETMLAAFAAFRARPAGQDWQLVLCGDLAGTQGAASFERITDRGLQQGARVLLDPPLQVWRDLLGRAKVLVSADSLGFRAADAESISSLCARDVVEAVAAGCVPLVHDTGPAAEMCELLGTGMRFASTQALADQLAQAATQPMPLRERERLDRFSWRAYSDRVKAIVDGTPVRSDHVEALPPPPMLGARRAFVVIGCHRSGTSAMARTLALAGASLPQRMMAPRPDNPTGFWEPLEIAALNDRVLESLGGRWQDVSAATSAERLDLFATPFVPQAREQLRVDYAAADAIVLKDPRISLLVPLWDSALLREGFRPQYVIMVRSPFEVAESLHRRNHIDRERGLQLWSSHLLSAERHTRGLDRIFVSFDDLLADAEAVLHRVEAAFGISLPQRDGARQPIRSFLDPSLHHFRDAGLTDPSHQPFQSLYEAALPACRGKDVPSLAWDGQGRR
jgi:GT2 family glycosyltransferase